MEGGDRYLTYPFVQVIPTPYKECSYMPSLNTCISPTHLATQSCGKHCTPQD